MSYLHLGQHPLGEWVEAPRQQWPGHIHPGFSCHQATIIVPLMELPVAAGDRAMGMSTVHICQNHH